MLVGGSGGDGGLAVSVASGLAGDSNDPDPNSTTTACVTMKVVLW